MISGTEDINWAIGVKVLLLIEPLTVKGAVEANDWPVSVKLACPMVARSIGSLKTAEIVVTRGTLMAAAAGCVPVTVGRTVSGVPVVKRHTLVIGRELAAGCLTAVVTVAV